MGWVGLGGRALFGMYVPIYLSTFLSMSLSSCLGMRLSLCQGAEVCATEFKFMLTQSGTSMVRTYTLHIYIYIYIHTDK